MNRRHWLRRQPKCVPAVPRTQAGRRHSILSRAACIEQLETRTLLADITQYLGSANSMGVMQDSTLTATKVESSFQKLKTIPTVGDVTAEPLVVNGVTINGQSRNIVIVATSADRIYALDAEGKTTTAFWERNLVDMNDSRNTFVTGAVSATPVANTDIDSGKNQNGTPIYADVLQAGILSTPVIDGQTNTLFVVAKTKEVVGTGTSAKNHYVYRLHVIDLRTGDNKVNPVLIADTVGVPGSGTANVNHVSAKVTSYDPAGVSIPASATAIQNGADDLVNGRIFLNSFLGLQRAALTLVNGVVYVAFASQGDFTPYHGWILGYGYNDTTKTVSLKAVFNPTPTGKSKVQAIVDKNHDGKIDANDADFYPAGGGVWLSGGRISADSQGNLFPVISNGLFDVAHGDYGDSIVKLVLDPNSTQANPNGNLNGFGLRVADYFTPHNQLQLQADDDDLGSGGVLLLPDSAGTAQHPHLAVFGGKEGKIYVVDRDNLGGFHATDQVVDEAQTFPTGASFDTPAFINGKVVYVATVLKGKADAIRFYTLSNGQLQIQPSIPNPDGFYTGATPVISANGSSNPILWVLEREGNNLTDAATKSSLQAYDLNNIGVQLFTSNSKTSDNTGAIAKFAVPTVANGKVYVASLNGLQIFGLGDDTGVTNRAPVAREDSVNSLPPTSSIFKPVLIDVLENDTDPDNDSLSIVPGSITASKGKVELITDPSDPSRKVLRYTAQANSSSDYLDTFNYSISDGQLTATAKVVVHVHDPNLPNILVPDAGGWTISTNSTQPIHFDWHIESDGSIHLDKTATFTSGQPIVVRMYRFTGQKFFFNLDEAKITNSTSKDLTGLEISVLDANGNPRPQPVITNHTDPPHEHLRGSLYSGTTFKGISASDQVQTITLSNGVVHNGGSFTETGVVRFHDPSEEFFDWSETPILTTPIPQPGGPTARNDSASVKPSNDVHVHVLDNDTGSGLKITSVNKPSHGTTKINTRGTSDPSDDFVEYVPSYGYHGTDSFKYTITDKNGKTAQATVNLTVIPGVGVGTDPRTKQSALDVFGTPSGDKITLTGATGGINVSFNGSNLGFFKFAGGAFVDAAGGHDTVKVVNSGRSFVMWGGTGNDLLIGGFGRDALFGGIGADALFGNGGGDWLVGGRNADNLSGSDSTDILVAGTTDFDNDLSAQLGLNKASSLNSSNTHDDSDEDHLTGGTGTDILFANRSGGVVKDLIFGASDQLHELLA